MKPISNKVYAISSGYRKATVWTSSAISHRRIATTTCTPIKGTSRHERYLTICNMLTRLGINAPPYEPTKTEQTKS